MENTETLYRGDTHPVGYEGKEAVLPENTAKDYDAEAGGGFYLTDDRALAVAYAVGEAVLLERETGEWRVPYLHTYSVLVGDVKRKLRSLCFEAIEEGALRYIGYNIEGRFPEQCARIDELPPQVRPRDVCHLCEVGSCDWSAAYVEVLVSDNVSFCFDKLICRYVTGEVTFDEVCSEMLAELREHGVVLRKQYVFREPTGSYMRKIGDVPVPDEEVLRWKRFLRSMR